MLSTNEDGKRAPDTAFLLATLFGTLLSLGGGIFLFWIRNAFGSEDFSIPTTAYLRAFLFSGAIMLLPVAFGVRHGLRSTAALLFVLLACAFMPSWFKFSLDIATVLIWFFGIRLLWGLKLPTATQSLTVLAIATLCSVIYGFVNLALNYATPIVLEAALVGLAHHDTLFHAAIAESLTRFGVASIGVDGHIPLVYHVFSHRVIGGFAEWLGVPALQGYSLFVGFVAVPVLVALLLQASAQLLPAKSPNVARPVATFSVLTWLALGGALMWHSYYVSESYNISLWFLILAVLVFQRMSLASTEKTEHIVALTLLAGLVGLAALSKISVGFVLGAAVAAGLAFQGQKKPWFLLASVLAGLLPPIAVYLSYPVSGGTNEPMFVPFAFFAYERPAVYALLLASVLTVLALRRMPADSSRKSLVVALLSGMWAGLGASYVLNAPAGAQYYFSDPGSWLGIMVIPVLGMVPRWISDRTPKTGFLIVSGMIIALLALHDDNLRGLEQIRTWRAAFASATEPNASTLREASLKETPVGRVVTSVIDHNTAVDAVLIDANFSEFWMSQKTCWAASIVVPALTGKPMLMGIVPQKYGCEVTPYYGFADYSLSDGQALANPDQEEICQIAAKRDFGRVLLITAENSMVISCASDTNSP